MNAEQRAKHNAASVKWKNANRAYYLCQKRALSARESYKAHRRAKYREKMQRLREAEDYVCPKRGRPTLYSPMQALQRRRAAARSWAAARRLKEKLSVKEKDLHYEHSETAGSKSD